MLRQKLLQDRFVVAIAGVSFCCQCQRVETIDLYSTSPEFRLPTNLLVPENGPPRFPNEGRMSMTKSGSAWFFWWPAFDVKF